MKLSMKGTLLSVKESVGSFEGRAFDSCTFHVVVDVADNSSGRSVGCVTRPFKCGKGKDIENWIPYGDAMKAGGLPVDMEFEMVAGADKATVMNLVSIKPSAAKK